MEIELFVVKLFFENLLKSKDFILFLKKAKNEIPLMSLQILCILCFWQGLDGKSFILAFKLFLKFWSKYRFLLMLLKTGKPVNVVYVSGFFVHFVFLVGFKWKIYHLCIQIVFEMFVQVWGFAHVFEKR